MDATDLDNIIPNSFWCHQITVQQPLPWWSTHV